MNTARRVGKNRIIVLVATAILLFGNFVVYADSLIITLDPTSFTINPGQAQVDVWGTLTNISSDTIFLNSDSITVPSAENISDYFVNTPLWLAAGESSGLILLFSFDVLLNATLGTEIGNYTILGGDANDPGAFEVLGSQDFAVNIQNSTPTSPVPEPATVLLSGIGLLTLAGFGRKKTFE